MILRHGMYAQRNASTPTVLIPGDGTTSWVNVAATATVGLGTMIKSSGGNSWRNCGASFGSIPSSTAGELYMEYTSTSSAIWNGMFGLSESDPDYNYTSIKFGMFPHYNGNIYVFENGTSVYNASYNFDVFNDNCEVKRDASGNVTYYHNGALIYTSLVTSTAELIFDSSIYRNIGAKELKITY